MHVCVSLQAKANPLPTGVSPGASYNKRKMSHGEFVHTLINECQPGSIFTHVQACVSRCVCRIKRVLIQILCFIYLLDVIVQCNDFQGSCQICTGWDGRSHRRGLTHVSLIGGELEVWRLVVLIQDLDDEVSIGWEWVTVVLLGLKKSVIVTLTNSKSSFEKHCLM